MGLACGAFVLFAVGAVVAEGPGPALRAELERALAEFDLAQEVQADRPDRARELLRSAAQRFRSLISAGIRNGPLHYNLGNCYLLMGDIGRAILNYQRAQRWMPRDPLLADNLREARSRRVVQIEPTRGSAVLRSAVFWHYDTSVAGRTKAALVCYVVFWLGLTARLVSGRRWATVVAVSAAIVTVGVAGSVAVTHWSERNAPAGVVTALDVPVYKGPGEGYQRRFEQPLQPGVEFVVRERRGPWWRIELADGQGGWIESSAGELVPQGTS